VISERPFKVRRPATSQRSVCDPKLLNGLNRKYQQVWLELADQYRRQKRMADESHLSLLKQGVKTWNEWREQDVWFKPNLSGTDLNRADLVGANLIAVDLSGANLIEANLSSANLFTANLSGDSSNQVKP